MMTLKYRFSTFRQEDDLLVFSYEQIKFALKYHTLPYYRKNIYFDYIINKEIDYYIDNFTGIVKKSTLKAHGDKCEFMLEFTGGGTYYFEDDTYLNECSLVHNIEDARAVLYVLMEKAIKELQLSFYQRFRKILK
jgi:hypothetical protein